MANSIDPDQTPHYAVSDLGLHCLLRAVYSKLKCKSGTENIGNMFLVAVMKSLKMQKKL